MSCSLQRISSLTPFIGWWVIGLLTISLSQQSLAAYAQTAKPEVRTALISGRVTIEGKPAAGAKVSAMYAGAGDANFVITTIIGFTVCCRASIRFRPLPVTAFIVANN